MTLWKATISYDGTPFHGWQVQPGRHTVQGTLAAALQRISGEIVLPQGSGRTDAGVHALGQVASFELTAPIPAPNLHHALNRALPPSIRLLSLEAAPPRFHARHSAVRKTYEYRIVPRISAAETICSPMLAPYVWACPYRLDVGAMSEAAAHVLGTHDFTSFAAVDPDESCRTARESEPQEGEQGRLNRKGSCLPTPNIRTVLASEWTLHADEPLLRYRVTGSGFLHHMVRNLVGTFVEIGVGRLRASEMPSILAARDRRTAGPTAPARGLFLVEVDY
ncbi:tRNA pseudouridine synthase A [Granulicella sibirica]|uniref:tRNA pseudouridine synthase A n=1 Tax=Granulicella sibirica TaxID=2479048 RepID=A0A4Q0T2G0_9BACT|nr:tRNA pseudouridine synthase A [Granulicella sibirica]RXH56600.1 tRNA pseudouridine synthase A [Granulicella sibirica]